MNRRVRFDRRSGSARRRRAKPISSFLPNTVIADPESSFVEPARNRGGAPAFGARDDEQVSFVRDESDFAVAPALTPVGLEWRNVDERTVLHRFVELFPSLVRESR